MAKERYLIDTHCWLWWHIEPERLGKNAFSIIEDGRNEIFFSVISAWEISIKHSLKKLELPFSPARYIPERLSESYMDILPVRLDHTLLLATLPLHHKDPFDRMLIVQASHQNLTLITCDKQFELYAINTVF